MRKKLVLILLVLFSFGITVGCGNENKPNPNPTPEPNGSTVPHIANTIVDLKAGQRDTLIDWVKLLNITASGASSSEINVTTNIGKEVNLQYVSTVSNTSVIEVTATNTNTNESTTKKITVTVIDRTESQSQKDAIYDKSFFRIQARPKTNPNDISIQSGGMFLDYNEKDNELLLLASSVITRHDVYYVVKANDGKSSNLPTLCAELLYDGELAPFKSINAAIYRVIGQDSINNNCESMQYINLANHKQDFSLLNLLQMRDSEGELKDAYYLNRIKADDQLGETKYSYKLYNSTTDILTPYKDVMFSARIHSRQILASLVTLEHSFDSRPYNFLGLVFGNNVLEDAGTHNGLTPIVDENLNVVAYNSATLNILIGSTTAKRHYAIHHNEIWYMLRDYCQYNTQYSNYYICSK